MFKPKLDGPAILPGVRRVLHVENVGVRGLVLDDPEGEALARAHGVAAAPLVLSCYYTLALADDDAQPAAEPFYVSPLAVPALSPAWPPVRPDEFASEVPWTARRLAVRVLGVPAAGTVPGERGGGGRVLLETVVDMCSGLTWLRPPDTSTLPDLPPSSLLLFLPDGVYAPAGSPAALSVQTANEAARSRSGGAAPPRRSAAWRRVARQAKEASTRRAARASRTTVSDEMAGASTVFEAARAASEAEARLQALGRQVSEALARVPASEEARRLRSWRERLVELEEKVAGEERAARLEREDVRRLRVAHENQAAGLQRLAEQLEEERRRSEADLAERQLAAARSRLAAVEERLAARRRRMIHALSLVYPISRMGNSANTMASHTVRGQRLPARGLASIEDEQVSTALGYAAHLTLMLSKYLDVPLRYGIMYRGSRSAMRDDVHGFPECPLYTRGEEARRFEAAHALLRDNAEQLLRARQLRLFGKAKGPDDPSLLAVLDQVVRLEVPK